jgi:hypothetical protein
MSSSGPEANLFLLFTSRFDELKIPYMVTGSVATILYGAIRLTHDVDIVPLLFSRGRLGKAFARYPGGAPVSSGKVDLAELRRLIAEKNLDDAGASVDAFSKRTQP